MPQRSYYPLYGLSCLHDEIKKYWRLRSSRLGSSAGLWCQKLDNLLTVCTRWRCATEDSLVSDVANCFSSSRPICMGEQQRWRPLEGVWYCAVMISKHKPEKWLRTKTHTIVERNDSLLLLTPGSNSGCHHQSQNLKESRCFSLVDNLNSVS